MASPRTPQTALVVLLRAFRRDAIVNINSGTLYRGDARPTAGRWRASERVFLCFFCNEQDAAGALDGLEPALLLPPLRRRWPGVITDSEHLARELAETHQLPASQRRPAARPAGAGRPGLPFVAEAPARDGPPTAGVLGRPLGPAEAGRRCFLDVARRMPDVDFRMWGETAHGRAARATCPPTSSLEGPYAHISEIPLAEADAWLYTSGWDGVPSQLLEVAMTGVPIVGTLVGGTGEVLHDGRVLAGRARTTMPTAYVEALREVLADPAEARRRAAALRERLLRGADRRRPSPSRRRELLLRTGEREGAR